MFFLFLLGFYLQNVQSRISYQSIRFTFHPRFAHHCQNHRRRLFDDLAFVRLTFCRTRRLKPLQNPKTIHLFWGFHYIQHKHNKIKQNNHTNPTITAHFQAALCPFRQQSAQQALTCSPL